MEDISSHLLDLLMNAMEAGATEIFLTVEENKVKDYFKVIIKDNGKGMDQEMIQKATNPFMTERTTRKVGLGLSLVHALTQQCNGEMSIESKPGKGTTIRIRIQLSHWDRPPLGDLAGTLIVFLCCSLNLRLCYRHLIDDRCFFLDTREIEKTIAPVPINNAKILEFLKGYIRQELNLLET